MQVETSHCEVLKKSTCANVNRKSKIDECIDSIVRNEGYITYNVTTKDISTDGGNYLGVLSEIDIDGQTADGYKETAIFCKMMSPDHVDLGFMSLQNVYNRELFAYKDLSKVITQIQDEAEIPAGERFKTVKCYDESYEQMLFMDNMSRKGYKTWHRMDVVTLEMAEICIKQLARFHGTSFAIKELKPSYFEEYIKPVNTPLKVTKEWDEFVEKFYKIGMDNLDDELKRKTGSNIRRILDKYIDYLSDRSSQYALCHGDYRPNNILIKEKNGIIVDAVPVDYQLMFYGCPLIDFFYFVYMATDHDFRRLHLNHLKDLYYDSLEIYLRNFDISVEAVFPRKQFEFLYEEKRGWGVITAFFYTPFLFVAEGEVPDVTKESMADIEFKLDEKFRHRMNGTIQEFIEIGIL